MKNQFYKVLILALLFIPFFNVSAAEVPSDFSMVGTWKAEYKSQKITIDLQDDHKGLLTVDGLNPVTILKWDVEFGKKGRVYVGLYFYSRDKERFVKRGVRMYNQGTGFKMKAIYQENNHLKVYGGLVAKDGKIGHDGGKMELKR